MTNALSSWSAFAKAPGATWCYDRVCHRVRSITETRALVGKTLNVMASHYDDPRYDRMNTGKYTSNGETFDANNPARVSSSEFPDGTELLIRNPENGLTSHVKVNDFGPFYRDRTLDVTRRVARDLGFVKRGVTALDVTVIAEPRGDEASYRRNRVMQPALGHLGLVEAEDVPETIAGLIQRAEPAAVPVAAAGVSELPSAKTAAAAVEGLVRATPLPALPPPKLVLSETRDAISSLSRFDDALPELVEHSMTGPEARETIAFVEPLSPDVLPLLSTDARDLPLVALSEPRVRWKEKASPGTIRVLAAGMGQPDLVLFIKMSILTTLLAATAWGVSELRGPAGSVGLQHGSFGAGSDGGRRLRAEPLSAARSPLQLATSRGGMPGREPWPPQVAEKAVDIWRFSALHSLVGADIEIEGCVVSQGPIVVAGTVRGWVTAPEIVILPGGSVEGQAKAGRIEIGGRFAGCLIANSVRVTPEGALLGEVLATHIAVDEGGLFEGTCWHKAPAPELETEGAELPAAA